MSAVLMKTLSGVVRRLRVGMIQIREITVLITAPKGGLLGEEANVSTLVRHVRLHLFCLSSDCCSFKRLDHLAGPLI